MNALIPARYELVTDRRAIIDRRALAERLSALPDRDLKSGAARILKQALVDGRVEIGRRLEAEPYRGRAMAAAHSLLIDQILRLAHDVIVERFYPNPNPLPGERLALVGLGGTGRGEMAPYSDVDLMILVNDRRAPWIEQVAEALLYMLWDIGLKVGQSVRTQADALTLARDDMTVRTSLLEARWIWGDQTIFDRFKERFQREIVAGTGAEFVAAKLAERDRRHERLGDSRYVVEPNVKDGKGGLRDLHTLYWIGKYIHGVDRPSDLVEKGLLTSREFRRFERAERFFWSVRCHLHREAGRAEERLGFQHQTAIARAMRYADRPGKPAVERFMHFYFLNAKAVGDLTGLFLAQLDEQLGSRGRRFALPTLHRRPRRLAGFVLDRGRLSVPAEEFFEADPVRLIEMFALAAREGLEIHPRAMRAAAREARKVDGVRDDPRANALFLKVLSCRNRPELALRWMNEAGVFGRFVPDFGRVVAQMQFDMYHHFTVDEHSIRAIGLTAAIERGELTAEHPLASALFRQIGSRRTLYVAVLLHDIAKGRGGDHSELGAEIALNLGPRFGLTDAETETVSWLVRHHLLLSNTAFRRDLSDPKTIEDFVRIVQSPERLRLLLILTVVDIRAVGPGVWNEWKRLLLRSLYDAAEERLRLGHKERGRQERVQDRVEQLAAGTGWRKPVVTAHARRLPDSYWLAEPTEVQVANALQMAQAEARFGDPQPSVIAINDEESGATRISIFSPDRPGLFYRVCAALAAAGANIVDARIHTTRDGMALDNFLVHDGRGRAYGDRHKRARLAEAVEQALALDRLPELPPVRPLDSRAGAFRVAPSVVVADRASSRTTVVEVNARDREGLLARLARGILDQGLIVHSAHIATFGERAVDVFYLTGPDRQKLDSATIESLRVSLLSAAAPD